MNEELAALENFSGVARLFPLPNLVLFPAIVQGLHIFEQRYRQMTADALAGDRLIALVLLRPGWEADYEGTPAIDAIGCLGRIIWDERLDDGRYNLQLRGLRRVRIVEELEGAKLYRQARVELLEDVNPPGPNRDKTHRRQLLELIPKWIAGQAADLLPKLLHSNLPLGAVCDIFAYALPVPKEVKQGVLGVIDVAKRAKLLIRHLQSANPPDPSQAPEVVADRKFPPDFSSN